MNDLPQPRRPQDDEHRAEVVPLYPTAAGHQEPVDAEVVAEHVENDAVHLPAHQPGTALQPSRRQKVGTIGYYAAALPPTLGRAAKHAPVATVKEIVPVWHGAVAVLGGWYRVVWLPDRRRSIDAMDEKAQMKALERLSTQRKWRGGVSVGVVLVITVTVWYGVLVNITWVILAGILMLGGLDLLGRRLRKPNTAEAEERPRQIRFTEGMPLRAVTQGILDAFEAEGVEVEVVRMMTWDQNRLEYRLGLASTQAIKPDHLRAVERWCGFADYGIRILGTDTAAERDLVIRVGDPLAQVPKAPWLPTGSRSIADPLDMGASASDVPYALRFAGTHAIVLGMTGSGKTKGTIWTAIDRLSACRDVVLWGIDLQQGPALPMWRGVIQNTAYTPEDAADLLADAIREVQRRMRILQAIAEDDDPSNDTDEWNTALAASEGPALVLVIDEFSLLAAYDGKGGKLDLLGPVIQIARTGRKVWETLLLGTQNTGTGDVGATQLWKQLGLKLAGPCELSDATALFGKDKRDAGWTPHLLRQAQDDDPRDAGKVFIDGPGFTAPDVFRSYAPLSTREVKERARQRLTDGLPTLDGGSTVDVHPIPDALVVFDAAFSAVPETDRLPSEAVLGHARRAGFSWTAEELASQVRPWGLRSRDAKFRGETRKCYFRHDVAAAINAAEKGQLRTQPGGNRA